MADMTQEQLLKQVLKLKEENPEMEIHFLVSCDDTDPDFCWVAHKISCVEISPWFSNGEHIYTDTEDIIDHLMEGEEFENLDDDEAEKLAKEKYNAEVKHAICVYTRAE